MSGLVRAEWLRLRRRKDIWFVCLALLALSIVAYGSGLSSARQMFGGAIPEDMPPDAVNDIRHMMQQEMARYAFPQSIITVLANGQMLVLALLAYLAAALTGAEFAYGTIRTTLVARPDRRGFLTVRLLALAVIALVVLGLLVTIGAIMPSVAGLLGQDWADVAQPTPASLAGALGALLLASAVVIGSTTLFAVLLHNSAIALVLTVALVLIDGVLHGLMVRIAGGNEEALIAWMLPVSNLQLLASRGQGNNLAPEITTALAVGIALAWSVALWVGSIRLLAVADIRD